MERQNTVGQAEQVQLRTPIRILVTGSRKYRDKTRLDRVLLDVIAKLLGQEAGHDEIENVVIVHGAARGADELARQFAVEYDLAEEGYPAKWTIYGRRAGRKRNQQMVDLGASIVVAFPLPGSIGTWDCVARAQKAGIRVLIIPHREDGGSSTG